MKTVREITAQARQETHIPEVLGERCVHSLLETASCRACLNACPRDAWVLDDELLGIDTEACDGCGLCAPACPQGAVVSTTRFALRQWRDEKLALGCCEKVGLGDGDGSVGCLHGLGLSDLLVLYKNGVRRLLVSAADCDSCERGAAVRLNDRLDELNRVLSDTGLSKLHLSMLPGSDWQQVMAGTSEVDAGPVLSRRGFFRNLATTGLEAGLQRAGLVEESPATFQPPGRVLPGEGSSCVPFLPRIDVALCTGCDACIRLCPQQALKLDESQPGYVIDAPDCSGCRICVDVCEAEAVSVLQWQPWHPPNRIQLVSRRCKACGVPFHVPDHPHREVNECCPICARHNHYRQLFQVLE